MSFAQITAITVGILSLGLSTATAKASGEIPGKTCDIEHDPTAAGAYARNLMTEAKQPGTPSEDVSDSLIDNYNDAANSNYSKSQCGKFVSDPVTAAAAQIVKDAPGIADPAVVQAQADEAAKKAGLISAQMVASQIFKAGNASVVAPGVMVVNPNAPRRIGGNDQATDTASF